MIDTPLASSATSVDDEACAKARSSFNQLWAQDRSGQHSLVYDRQIAAAQREVDRACHGA